MITRLELLLKAEENKKLKYSDGSYFQGYLMSLLDTDYVQYLHSIDLNPYSQYVYYDKDREACVWRITTLTKEAKENIILPILNADIKQIHIDNTETTYKVISKGITVETDYKNISDKYFSIDQIKRYINLRLLTPTTYKSDNKYQIFPDIKSLYVSLYNKWNRFNTTVSLDDEDVLDHLVEHTIIDRYDLRSSKFPANNTKIGGFIGDITLYVKGPEPLVNVANMLFDYAQYSGLGAKTGMGMGGVENE